jgi:pimeloyl-ACP methyl ester carboxylesterase
MIAGGKPNQKESGSGAMGHANMIGGTFAVAVGLLLPGPVLAAEWPDGCQEATLPSDDPNHPDAQVILTCLPPDFNGTLIVYAHGYVKPQEPLALPEEFGEADVREVIEQLLNLGFGVATSSYHKNGYAIEQAEADLNDLVAHVQSIEPDVGAVYVIGGSEGALIATMLVEKYPQTYAGGLALCGPLAGTSYQVAHLADVRVLFDYFYPEVFPFGALDVPEDAFAQWEGPDGYKDKIAAAIEADPGAITQVFNVAGVACDTADHHEAANCAQNMLAYSVFGTNDLLDTAGAWPVSNVASEYSGSVDDAALNVGIERFDADAAASAYADLHYRPSGLLQRPLVTLHTTGDPGVPYRHELIYFNRAALLGTDDQLTVLPVDRAGHCAFESQEVVGGLAALLLNADSDLVLALVEPLEALHGIVDADIGPGRLPELVQAQASAFLDRLENEFGFLSEARHVATDGLDAVTDLGGDAVDAAEHGLDAGNDAGGNAAGAAQDGIDPVQDLGGNAADAAQDAIDPVQDVGDEAKEKIEDLF